MFNNFYQENSETPTSYYEIELYNSYPLNYRKNKCILYINNILDLNNELKEINEPSADLIIIENTPQIFKFKNINDTIKLKYPNVNKDKSLMINIRLINVDEYRIYFYENLKKIIKKYNYFYYNRIAYFKSEDLKDIKDLIIEVNLIALFYNRSEYKFFRNYCETNR